MCKLRDGIKKDMTIKEALEIADEQIAKEQIQKDWDPFSIDMPINIIKPGDIVNNKEVKIVTYHMAIPKPTYDFSTNFRPDMTREQYNAKYKQDENGKFRIRNSWKSAKDKW